MFQINIMKHDTYSKAFRQVFISSKTFKYQEIENIDFHGSYSIVVSTTVL